MKFTQWLETRFLRSHRERDPFARQEVVGTPVDAAGKTCTE